MSNIMVIDLQNGFANRIRTLLGYLFVARKKQKQLFVVWRNSKDCPGRYLQYLEQIPGVVFLNVPNNPQFNLLQQRTRIHVFRGQMYLHKVVKKYGLSISQKEIIDLYRELHLRPRLRDIVNTFSKTHHLSDVIGVHIRRTDHPRVAMHWMKKYTSDTEFHQQIQKAIQKNPQQMFYLATDNCDTQKAFKKEYPSRIITYTDVPMNISALRKTSLEHSILDAFLLSCCQRIIGSYFSSFTTLAERLHAAHEVSPSTITKKEHQL